MQSHDTPWHEEVLGEAAERILKSLTYFDDAEREPMPDILAPLAWDDVKQSFSPEVTPFSARFEGESGV